MPKATDPKRESMGVQLVWGFFGACSSVFFLPNIPLSGMLSTSKDSSTTPLLTSWKCFIASRNTTLASFWTTFAFWDASHLKTRNSTWPMLLCYYFTDFMLWFQEYECNISLFLYKCFSTTTNSILTLAYFLFLQDIQEDHSRNIDHLIIHDDHRAFPPYLEIQGLAWSSNSHGGLWRGLLDHSLVLLAIPGHYCGKLGPGPAVLYRFGFELCSQRCMACLPGLCVGLFVARQGPWEVQPDVLVVLVFFGGFFTQELMSCTGYGHETYDL